MIEWINQTFGIKNEVSVPTLISLIVFLLGGLINFLFSQIRNWNNRKIYRETFYLLLSEVIKDLKIKENNMNGIIQQMTITFDGNRTYSQKSISYLDTIFELDYKEVFYSFRKNINSNFCNQNIKNKAFHKIWAILKDLIFFENKIFENLDSFSATYNSQLGNYNSHLENYRELTERQLHDKEIKDDDMKKTQTYSDKEDKIWNAWHELGELRTHYYYSYNFLVNPLLKLNREFSDLRITLEKAQNLVHCELHYNELKNTIDSYTTVYKTFQRIYRNDNRLLKKCLKLLKA